VSGRRGWQRTPQDGIADATELHAVCADAMETKVRAAAMKTFMMANDNLE
jgi:hypothetical protein